MPHLHHSAALCAACLSLFTVPAWSQNYELGPDSQVQPEVPHGTVTHYTLKKSVLYPGTERDYWVYVPKQYDPATPASVMVFQDGGGFQDVNGQWRVPVVFDNLIAKKEMPITIGIFVNPGVAPALSKAASPRFNRSLEYDAVDGRYARFLLEELLPEVGRNYKLTSDPNGRGLCGASSGGIASFTAAWERSDAFRRVYCCIGSFTDLRGGNLYPPLIRKTEAEPLRIFLQDGSNDQDIYSGSWPLGNSDVAAALKYAGYDTQFIVGTGGHDGRQGGSLLPDALRWLWHDFAFPIAAPQNNRQPVMGILLPGEGWQEAGSGIEGGAGDVLAADAAESVFVADGAGERIYRIGMDGKAVLFAEKAGGVGGMTIGPDGRLFVVERDHGVLASYDTGGKRSVITRGAFAGPVTITHDGILYASGTVPGGFLWRITLEGQKSAVSPATFGCRSLCLTPDQSLLLATPGIQEEKFVTSYRFAPGGTLIDREPFFDLRTVYGSSEPYARGMAVDANGWLYVATEIGIQMLDQAGRVNGILLPPLPRYQTGALAFGGPDHAYLYATAGGKVYRRKTKAKGVLSADAPIRPPDVRL